MSTIGQALRRADNKAGNNFDALRLVAALLVLVSHCYPLLGRPDLEPIGRALYQSANGGSLAVGTFFVISGFLVARSVSRRTPTAYVAARILRVWPALAVAIVIQGFCLGAACSTLPLRAYLAHPETWDWLHGVWVFDQRLTLPGVFTQNPFPCTINGSLWTLPVECGFYLALPLLLLLGLLRRVLVLGVAAASFGLWLWLRSQGYSTGNIGPFVIWEVPLYSGADMLLYFISGVVLWVHRDDVPLSLGLVVAALIAVFASLDTMSSGLILHLALPYCVIWLALAHPLHLPLLQRLGDVSYGTYLYAFPIQQAIIQATHAHIAAHTLMLIAAPPVLLLGFLSSRLVERPVLRLKRRALEPSPTERAGAASL